MPPEFTITRTIRGGTTVLVLEGELDMSAAPTLETVLTECPAGEPVIADLTLVNFLDSSGLHVLLKGPKAGGPAALIRASGSNVARVLQVVDARRAIPVFDELEDAIERLRDSAA